MTDMTIGTPRSHLLLYALPLLLGNWLQLSYNAVDSIIAGRFIGKAALAAEGIAGPVMNLVILAVSGLCIGAGVLMSEAFGTRDFQKLKKALANTLILGSSICCLVALESSLPLPFCGCWQSQRRFMTLPSPIFALPFWAYPLPSATMP